MPIQKRRGTMVVDRVGKGEPLIADRVNQWRDKVADLSLGTTDGLLHHRHHGGTTIALEAVGGGVNVGHEGIRLRCFNMESRTIPQYSVVEVRELGVGDVAGFLAGGWPNDPGVLVMRPKQGSLSSRLGWIDVELPGDTEGTVIVGGWAVVWLYGYKDLQPFWSGATVRASYEPNSPAMFCATIPGSYRMFECPVGQHSVLAYRQWTDTPPDWGYHPEVDSSDFHQKRMAVVQFKSWWG
jgi:hypothetical protein